MIKAPNQRTVQLSDWVKLYKKSTNSRIQMILMLNTDLLSINQAFTLETYNIKQWIHNESQKSSKNMILQIFNINIIKNKILKN